MTLKENVEKVATDNGWAARKPILPIDGFRFVKKDRSVWVYFTNGLIDQIVLWEDSLPEKFLGTQFHILKNYLETEW